MEGTSEFFFMDAQVEQETEAPTTAEQQFPFVIVDQLPEDALFTWIWVILLVSSM